MNNLNIIEQVNEAIYCFENEYGINLSNKGFNVLKTLVKNLKEEIILSGYKGSDKKRIQTALKYQNNTFKRNGSNKVLGLCHYENGYQYFGSCSWFTRLQHDNIIKELKSTEDDFEYCDKKVNITFKSSNSKQTYPKLNKLFVNDFSNWDCAFIDCRALCNRLNAEKRNVLCLMLNNDKVYVVRENLITLLVVANLYDNGYVKVNYHKGKNTPIYFDENSILALCIPAQNQEDIILDYNV